MTSTEPATARPGQSDPSALAGLAGLSGLELIQAMRDLKTPPPNIASIRSSIAGFSLSEAVAMASVLAATLASAND